MATHKHQKLTYRVLYCSGEDPLFPVSELLYNSPHCKGWCSAKFCEYPQEIILQFTHLVRIREIQLLIHQSKIPMKIELHSFLPSGMEAIQGELPLTKIKFEKLGYLEFDPNEKTKFQARELKSAYVDSMAMLLKLLIIDSHPNKINIFNQVSVIAVNCLGEYYVPPNGLRDPLPMGGRFEEEMQYDISTIEKLKQLYESKKQAVNDQDFERAKKIQTATERLKGIGTKLNELVERKRQALDKNDFNLAKKFKDEIDNLRMSVLNTKLVFEPTKIDQQMPSMKQLPQPMNRRSIIGHPDQNQQQFQKVLLTTEIILKDRKNYEQPIPDKDRFYVGDEAKLMRSKIGADEVDRSMKHKAGNLDPITMEELMIKRGAQRQIQLDEQVVPALASQANKMQELIENDIQQQQQEYNPLVQLGQAEDLGDDDMKLAEPLIPVFGMELVKKIFSSDWHQREQGIMQIQEEAKLGTKSEICGSIDQERLFTACIGAVSNTVADRIAQVCVSSLQFCTNACREIFPTITMNVKSDLNRYVDRTCTWMLDKIGDNNARVRENTEEAALALASHPSIGAPLLVNHITKGQVKKSAANSVKHITGRLQLLRKIIIQEGIRKAQINPDACIEYALSNLESNNNLVRSAAYAVVIETYAQVGGIIKKHFINLRPVQLDIIERSLNNVDDGNMEDAYAVINQAGASVSTSQHISKQTSNAANLKKSQPTSQFESKTISPNQSGKTSPRTSRAQTGKNSPSNKTNTGVRTSGAIKQSKNNINFHEEESKWPSCQFCAVKNEDFDREEVIDLHYWKDCKFLTQCQYCEQVIEIPMLNIHWLSECEKKNQLKQCKKCKEIMAENIYEKHTVDLKCEANPKNEPRCPLCIAKIPVQGNIADSGWAQHLMQDGCPKNPRNFTSRHMNQQIRLERASWQLHFRRKHNITIKLRYKCQTELGQYIKIVGNIPELGNWQPCRGIKMKTNSLIYPFWQTEISVPISNIMVQRLEYKYVVYLKKGCKYLDEIVRWEKLELPTTNRYLFLSRKPLTLKVQDEEEKSQHIFVQEYEKFICSMEPTGDDESPFPVLSEQFPPHSLRDFERLIAFKEKFQDNESFYSDDSMSGFSSFMLHPSVGAGNSLLGGRRFHSSDGRRSSIDQHEKSINGSDLQIDKDDIISPRSLDENVGNLKEEKKSAQKHLQFQEDLKQLQQPEEEEEVPKISNEDRLIMVSLKLPINVWKNQETNKWEVKEAPSLLYPTLYKFREKKFVKLTWIGWLGQSPEIETQEDKDEIIKVCQENDCIPVFIPKDILNKFFYYFETIIYPLFHSFKGLNDSNDDLADIDLWNAYKELNMLMAQEVIKARKDQRDLIWVNDIHFLLVPYYLRERDNNSNIGLFIHSAFPNSQIMQIFPQRNELLSSMLSSDCIGFHLFEYGKNFMTACKKLLDYDYEFRRGGQLGVNYNGRNVMLTVGHVGIEKQYIEQGIKSQRFSKCYNQWQDQKYKKKIIIAAVDYMHPISGVENKLRAFYNFLDQNPKKVNQVILIQYTVPLKTANDEIRNHQMFKGSSDTIDELVEMINKRFGEVVIYRNQGADKAERLSLWSRANVLLNTSLKDGLCLQPLEFLAVKHFLNKSSDSAIIMSEFAGVSQAISGVHKVNPQNIDQIQQKIEKVLSMSTQEKKERFESAVNYIERHSTLKWAHGFLLDLKKAHKPINLSYYMGANNNSQIRLMREAEVSVMLKSQMKHIQKAYSASKNRLIIIDHEGTLPRKINADPEPSPMVLSVLDQLTRDKRNTVFVVSPHSKKEVHHWFSQLKSLGLSAEEGFLYRFNSQFKNEYEWSKLIEIDQNHQEWMQLVEELMSHYLDKTDGAFIDRKESTIVFDYTDADSQFGFMVAKELSKHISQLISKGYPIQKVYGQSYLEVKPSELKKSLLLERIAQAITSKFKLDFILYVGDDSSNEEVFTYLNQVQKTALKDFILSTETAGLLDQELKFQRECKIFTCTVGKKPTTAKYCFKDNNDMCVLLSKLSNESIKIKRNRSAADMIEIEENDKSNSSPQDLNKTVQITSPICLNLGMRNLVYNEQQNSIQEDEKDLENDQ